jgi:hypothetical protein
MTIPPNILREFLQPYTDTLELRTPENKADSRIPYTDALSKAYSNEIEAVCSAGGRIRFFRMLRPEERPEVAEQVTGPVHKTREPIGAALMPFYEEQCGSQLVGTLCRVTRGGQMLKWDDRQGFRPGRFNPDRVSMVHIPEPLRPPSFA